MSQLKSMTLPEIGQVMKEMGQPAFRGKQVFTWLHSGVRSYEEMTNLPKALRDCLAEKYPLHIPQVVRKQESKKDGTIKYLWELSDGNCVETVLMRYHYGNTVCISTEVGCRMGCAFCASTLGGLVRKLEPFEMLDQVLFTQIDSGLPISHIVLMGIGEPLDNFDNVMRFLELVNSPDGMNISMRHISLSTCGLVPGIDKLAQKKLQLTLSISLHAPTDEIRNTIMPVNKAYSSEELIAACRRYYEKTGRRISFEYAMINGVNDTPEAAKILLKRLKGLPAHMNLIPLNHVEESPLKPSTRQAVQQFQKLLEDGGIPATVRRTLGSDIDASCGQLRRKYTKENKQ
ncbi:MAG: 23S rRNA (adenine(2503)-C(2))-methyltransferase RlmN [Oscillospiraceae bacterium]|nr:23S rRNA (adenine(2503)-C(2))-methyltransferase RlmN [Oscillospiraceae bacterium]